MVKKRYSAEQIIGKLREAEVLFGQGNREIPNYLLNNNEYIDILLTKICSLYYTFGQLA